MKGSRLNGVLLLYECEEKAMRIFMNGEEVVINECASLQDVIEQFEVSTNGLAVAVNAIVIPQKNWQSHQLMNEDAVMLIRAVQGG